VANIPDRASEISLAWITNALRCGRVPGADRLTGFEPETLEPGAFGELSRLRLFYDGPVNGAPASLILKLASGLTTNRAQAARFGLYEREVAFYKAHALGFPAPMCFGAVIDKTGTRFALLLEDLGALCTADQIAGVDIGSVLTAVAAIARGHARWWDHPPSWPPSLHDQPLAKLYRQAWPTFADRFGDELPDGSVALGERLAGDIDDLLDELSSGSVTVVHGDFRTDNLFFGVSEVKLVDWQLVSRARGIFDVAYFVGQCMTTADRRTHEASVIAHWRDALGIGGYSLADAHADYERSLYACITLVVVGGVLDRATERARRLARKQIIRAFNAATDWAAH
jgi:hypothetical protein